MNKQDGFSIAELGIVCVVVLLVGALGYVFYDRWIDGVAHTETAQISSADEVPAIATTEDLAVAEAALNDANLEDDSSLAALDSELASFE